MYVIMLRIINVIFLLYLYKAHHFRLFTIRVRYQDKILFIILRVNYFTYVCGILIPACNLYSHYL